MSNEMIRFAYRTGYKKGYCNALCAACKEIDPSTAKLRAKIITAIIFGDCPPLMQMKIKNVLDHRD